MRLCSFRSSPELAEKGLELFEEGWQAALTAKDGSGSS